VAEDLALLETEAGIQRRSAGAARLRGLVAVDGERIDLGRAVMVHEHARPEDLHAALDERTRHRRTGVGERLDGRDVVVGEPRMVHEVEVERRREVERGDALLLDQSQRLLGIPASLRDEAAADQVHGQQRMDTHRVVERHRAERAVAGAVAMLDDLREAAGAVGPVRARNALRPARRSGRVEDQAGLALVQIEGTGVVRPVRKRHVLADHHPSAAVLEAVLELCFGQAPRERDENGPAPLCRPVQERSLHAVVEDRRDPVARSEAEPARDSRGACEQLLVRQARQCLRVGAALGGVEEGEGKVHTPAVLAIASTIGS
jgi:hypothetical protein